MFFDKVNITTTENEVKISYPLRCFSTWSNFLWSIIALIPTGASIIFFPKLLTTLTNCQDISSVFSVLFQFTFLLAFSYGGLLFCFQRRGMIIAKTELVCYESTLWLVTLRYFHIDRSSINRLTKEEIPDREGWDITSFYLYYQKKQKELTREETEAISQIMDIPITVINHTKS